MLSHTVDFLAGFPDIDRLRSKSDTYKHHDRSTGSPDSLRSESSSDSPDSVTDMLLNLEKHAAVIATGRTAEKPTHSYIALISMAILSSKDKKSLLGDIYQFIMDRFPYYNNQDKAWRNSIRHNLSINECFIKNGRADNGKGNFWSIHPACVEDFAKGDFRRRQARRRARKGGKDMNRNSATNYSATPSTALGYQPMTSSPVGYQPMTSSPIGFKPMTPSPVTYQQMTSSAMGYQPVTAVPGGYQPLTASCGRFQPMTSPSLGFPAMTPSPVASFPFLPALSSTYCPTQHLSQKYHPYERPTSYTKPSSPYASPCLPNYVSPVNMAPSGQFQHNLVNLLNLISENRQNLTDN